MDTVTVRLSHKLTSLDQVNKVVGNVLGKLGCAGCLSGFDIRFTHGVDMAVDAKTLNVNVIGH